MCLNLGLSFYVFLSFLLRTDTDDIYSYYYKAGPSLFETNVCPVNEDQFTEKSQNFKIYINGNGRKPLTCKFANFINKVLSIHIYITSIQTGLFYCKTNHTGEIFLLKVSVIFMVVISQSQTGSSYI